MNFCAYFHFLIVLSSSVKIDTALHTSNGIYHLESLEDKRPIVFTVCTLSPALCLSVRDNNEVDHPVILRAIAVSQLRTMGNFIAQRRHLSMRLRIPRHRIVKNILPIMSQMNGRQQPFSGVSLNDIAKSHTFTDHLPADELIPSPEASRQAQPEKLRQSRLVKGALFTWIAPQPIEEPELIATSLSCLEMLGIKSTEVSTEEFKQIVSGNRIFEESYPWAQVCVIVGPK